MYSDLKGKKPVTDRGVKSSAASASLKQVSGEDKPSIPLRFSHKMSEATYLTLLKPDKSDYAPVFDLLSGYGPQLSLCYCQKALENFMNELKRRLGTKVSVVGLIPTCKTDKSHP